MNESRQLRNHEKIDQTFNSYGKERTASPIQDLKSALEYNNTFVPNRRESSIYKTFDMPNIPIHDRVSNHGTYL